MEVSCERFRKKSSSKFSGTLTWHDIESDMKQKCRKFICQGSLFYLKCTCADVYDFRCCLFFLCEQHKESSGCDCTGGKICSRIYKSFMHGCALRSRREIFFPWRRKCYAHARIIHKFFFWMFIIRGWGEGVTFGVTLPARWWWTGERGACF